MTTIRMTVDPQQTPAEEAQLIARVAAAVAASTGAKSIAFELTSSEDVAVTGTVADRMSASSRWSS